MFAGAHFMPGAFALVAMGAVFGAASRATFTFIIFAFEITQNYQSVLPLMLVSVIADGISLLFMKTSIMTEKLARRGLRIHTDYEADVLQQVSVAEAMSKDVNALPASMTVAELGNRINNRDPLVVTHQGFPVLNDGGELVGMITRGDILRSLERDPSGKQTVLEAGATNLAVAYPDQSLFEAAETMLRFGVGRLPVVSRENPKKIVGYLGRSGILAGRLRRVQEETIREPGWARRRQNA
jgi:CBS domain-containing protein